MDRVALLAHFRQGAHLSRAFGHAAAKVHIWPSCLAALFGSVAWQRQADQFDPQRIDNTLPVKRRAFLVSHGLTTARDELCEKSGLVLLIGPNPWYHATLCRGRLLPTTDPSI